MNLQLWFFSLQGRWKTYSTWEQLTLGQIDDPFLRPKFPEPTEEKKQQQGFGWHGRTLEDGVYEIDDEDEPEMGL